MLRNKILCITAIIVLIGFISNPAWAKSRVYWIAAEEVLCGIMRPHFLLIR